MSSVFGDLSFLTPPARPVERPSAEEQFRKYYTLRDMIEGHKFQQLQREEQQRQWAHQQQLWDQAQQDRAQSEAAYRAIAADPTLLQDPTRLYSQGPGASGAIKAITEARKAGLEAQEKQATVDKTKGEVEKQKREKIQSFRQDFMNGMMALRNEPDPQKREQMYWPLVAELRRKNFDVWDESLEGLASLPAPQTDADVGRLMTLVVGPDEARKYAAAQQETADKVQQAQLQRRLTEQQTLEAQQRTSGTVPITPYQRETLKGQEGKLTETELAWIASNPKEPQDRRNAANAALKRLDESKVASHPVVNVNTTPPTIGDVKLTGEDYIATLPPGVANQVRGILRGDLTMPSANSRAPGAQALRGAVMNADPTFSELRAQVRKNFIAGKEGQNLGAINTAIVHLGRLADGAEALQNGSLRPGNQLYQYFQDRLGSASTTNFQFLKDAVAGEMATALKGTATDQEIAHLGESIRASNSPEQMRGVVQEGIRILTDKARTYDERYHQQMPDDQWSPILPEARRTMERFGLPYRGAGAAGGSGATTGSYKYTATGPNGHKIGSNDGKKWVDLQTGAAVQ